MSPRFKKQIIFSGVLFAEIPRNLYKPKSKRGFKKVCTFCSFSSPEPMGNLWVSKTGELRSGWGPWSFDLPDEKSLLKWIISHAESKLGLCAKYIRNWRAIDDYFSAEVAKSDVARRLRPATLPRSHEASLTPHSTDSRSSAHTKRPAQKIKKAHGRDGFFFMIRLFFQPVATLSYFTEKFQKILFLLPNWYLSHWGAIIQLTTP